MKNLISCISHVCLLCLNEDVWVNNSKAITVFQHFPALYVYVRTWILKLFFILKTCSMSFFLRAQDTVCVCAVWKNFKHWPNTVFSRKNSLSNRAILWKQPKQFIYCTAGITYSISSVKAHIVTKHPQIEAAFLMHNLIRSRPL